MKLFLTGDINVGKSTIINQCLTVWKGPLWGYRTYRNNAGDVILTDPNKPQKEHIVARINPPNSRFFPEVFETVGVRLLQQITAETKGLVLMDEIGYIESEAPLFQREIERVLSLPVPVLGVLRSASTTPFLEALFAREDLTIWEVTRENRDEMTRKAIHAIK